MNLFDNISSDGVETISLKCERGLILWYLHFPLLKIYSPQTLIMLYASAETIQIKKIAFNSNNQPTGEKEKKI